MGSSPGISYTLSRGGGSGFRVERTPHSYAPRLGAPQPPRPSRPGRASARLAGPDANAIPSGSSQSLHLDATIFPSAYLPYFLLPPGVRVIFRAERAKVRGPGAQYMTRLLAPPRFPRPMWLRGRRGAAHYGPESS